MANGLVSHNNTEPTAQIFSIQEKSDWIIYNRYVQRDLELCKLLIDQELRHTKDNNDFAFYILGLIFREEGKIKNSYWCFHRYYALNPLCVEGIKQIARSCLLLGRNDEAKKMYLEAEKMCREPDTKIYFNLGLCYMNLGELDKSKEYFHRTIQLSRNQNAYEKLATIFAMESNFKNATSTLITASKLFPFSTNLSVDLGLLYMKQREYDQAFNVLGNTLCQDPVNPKALLTLAAEIQRNFGYDEALAKYTKAVGDLSECSETWNNIGMCFFGKHKYVAAISCLKRAVYLHPLNWIALYNLGLVHLYTRQYVSAFVFLSTSAKLNPNNASTFMLIGLVLNNMDDTRNAEKAYRKSIELNPNYPEALINLTILELNQGKVQEAKNSFCSFQEACLSGGAIDKEIFELGKQVSDILDGHNKCVKENDNRTTDQEENIVE
ncbi:Tetratricopeptide repeat,Tetratricopeptide repeat 1,Tetratricopeptide repeat-containing [Cinara cedri]|uniref:Tetratricopeptide repeat,Tetratricopeptide repeat 1,Tetratricopeptide repeat-containing n=1 Tax=Cinara cedri TaxID=506608 RepID=A0A5E4M063_9HEMI|nr:Tetratricopeptide repeat,Tetratricopeptide repeat 1,Tetratricopeptide repeat-containing [Cinara cedri]